MFFAEFKYFALDLTMQFSARVTETHQGVNVSALFELWAERINDPYGAVQTSSAASIYFWCVNIIANTCYRLIAENYIVIIIVIA